MPQLFNPAAFTSFYKNGNKHYAEKRMLLLFSLLSKIPSKSFYKKLTENQAAFTLHHTKRAKRLPKSCHAAASTQIPIRPHIFSY
jgi:hypothetical protein